MSEHRIATCKACGGRDRTTLVSFSMNIGLLFTRREEHMDGFLCRACVHRYFWRYTLVNLVGWLGLISLFAAPLYELKNIIQYVRVLSGRTTSMTPKAFRQSLPSGETDWKWPTAD